MKKITFLKNNALGLAVAAVLATGSISATSYAATSTATLQVSATIANTCSITANAASFGTIDPTVGNNTTADIISTCTSGAAAIITLGQGNNSLTGSDSNPSRQMSDGAGHVLRYNIASTSSGLPYWTNSASTDVSIAGTGSALTSTAYLRTLATSGLPAGSYTDTVVATVTY